MKKGDKYPIRYTIEFGDFKPSDAREDEGITENIIVVSCINQPDGSYSQTWIGYEGLSAMPMKTKDVFKAWILMAESLLRKEDLDPGRRAFLQMIWDTFIEATFGTKKVGSQ